MQFGYHMIGWDGELPDVLDRIKAVGFNATETFSLVNTYKHPREVRDLFDSKGMEITSMYCGGTLIDKEKIPAELEDFKRAADFLAHLGCKQMVLGGGTKKEGGNPRSDYERMGDTLNRVGEICKPLSLQPCYHPHLGTMVETAEQLDLVCELTDPQLVFLGPDCAHIQGAGSDAAAALKKHVNRIKYMHLKDWDGEKFVELGRGQVDIKSIINTLKDANYQGWIVIELDRSPSDNPAQSARISKRYLEEELGITI